MNTAPKKKLMFSELLAMAQSPDANERKRAWQLFQAWQKAAPRIGIEDRLTDTQCNVLKQLFKRSGFTQPPTRKVVTTPQVKQR